MCGKAHVHSVEQEYLAVLGRSNKPGSFARVVPRTGIAMHKPLNSHPV